MTDRRDPDFFEGELPPLDPDVAAWLGSDTPAPMPPEVWAQLESRLAQETPLVAAPTAVVDLETERGQRRRRGALLPVLAGAAGLVLVGAVVVPSLRGGDPVADGGSSVAVTEMSPATDTSGGPAAQVDADRESLPQAGALPAPATPRAMVATGIDYAAESMPAQLTTLLTSSGFADPGAVSAAMAATPSAMAMSSTGLGASPEALADCLGRLGLPVSSTPLLLDMATFDGAKAGVIVTVDAPTEAVTPRSLHVVAVGWDCDDADVANARHWDLPLAP